MLLTIKHTPNIRVQIDMKFIQVIYIYQTINNTIIRK